MRGPKDAEMMRDEANRLMEEGRFREAEAMFSEAFESLPQPAFINNWAACRLYQGDPGGTLEILQPNLASGELAPFARALAARAYAMVGRNDEAQKQLNQAIVDFEEGLRSLAQLNEAETTAWREYTVILKQAAGEIGKDQLVIDLYRRYESHHVTGEDRYLAGVAAFNLCRMDQAISYWSKLPRPDFPFIVRYIDVARRVDAGIFPKFRLEYTFPVCGWPMDAESDEEVLEMACVGLVRMAFLFDLLDSGVTPLKFEDALSQLGFVIEGDPEWGIQLAEGLLAYPGADRELRAAAAAALTQAGVYPPGEPISIVDEDGTESQIIVESHIISLESTPRSAEALSKALRYMDEEEYDKALATLYSVLQGNEVDYRIHLAIATAQMGQGNLDEAEDVLMMLDAILPEHPLLLLKLAELCLRRGETEAAADYLDCIDVEAEGPALQRAVDAIRCRIELEKFRPGGLGRQYAELMRERQERKRVSVNVKLSQALRSMPVEWLNAACVAHGIDPKKHLRRKERAGELEEVLVDATRTSKCLSELGSDEIELLRFLMEMGGWARLSEVDSEFGSMDGDGCWWGGDKPKSTLGKLVSKALVAIGSSAVNGRREGVVVVPIDLRPTVIEYAKGPRGE